MDSRRFPIPRNYKQAYIAFQLDWRGWFGWLPFLIVGSGFIYFGIESGFQKFMIFVGGFTIFVGWILFREVPGTSERPMQVIRRRLAARRRTKIFRWRRS